MRLLFQIGVVPFGVTFLASIFFMSLSLYTGLITQGVFFGAGAIFMFYLFHQCRYYLRNGW